MASDQTVTAKDVLAAVMELRRRAGEIVLHQLEQEEPDLTEFVLEELSAVHQELARTGATAKQLRRTTRRVEAMVVTAVLALRHAHLRLWQAEAGDIPPGVTNPRTVGVDPDVGADAPDATRSSTEDRRADPPHDKDHHAGGDLG